MLKVSRSDPVADSIKVVLFDLDPDHIVDFIVVAWGLLHCGLTLVHSRLGRQATANNFDILFFFLSPGGCRENIALTVYRREGTRTAPAINRARFVPAFGTCRGVFPLLALLAILGPP